MKSIKSIKMVVFTLAILIFMATTSLPAHADNSTSEAGETTVRAYPRPDNATITTLPDYTDLSVSVGGEELNLYRSGWRNLGQFEYSGTPTVTITAPVNIGEVSIYPAPYNIAVAIDGNTATFEMSEPDELKRKFAVEVLGDDGVTYQVDLLGDPIKTDKPLASAENVYYFGNGLTMPSKY